MKTYICFLAVTFVFVAPMVSVAMAQSGRCKARNDTVDLYTGVPVTVDLTANDSIPPGDSIHVMGGGTGACSGHATLQTSGNLFTYTALSGYNGECTGQYILRDDYGTGIDTSSANILFRFHDHSFDSLYINNVNARFSADGKHFFYETAKYEVPKFQGKSTIFTNEIWIGGKTADSILHLAGALMDPDGIDNPIFDNTGAQLWNASVNGTGFGDSIVDNERYRITGFIVFNNSNSGIPPYMVDPRIDTDYYNLMRGIWKDGTHLVYGGNGNSQAGGYGPACHFMYPGMSDTLY
jgi:hypothetical protein